MFNKDLAIYAQNELTIKVEIVKFSVVLNDSVDYLESQIERKLLEIEAAEADYRFDAVEGHKQELRGLLQKLKHEQRNLESFMLTFRNRIQNEEKKLLSCSGAGKQIPLWCFSTNTGGLQTSQSLQKETQIYPQTGLCS